MGNYPPAEEESLETSLLSRLAFLSRPSIILGAACGFVAGWYYMPPAEDEFKMLEDYLMESVNRLSYETSTEGAVAEQEYKWVTIDYVIKPPEGPQQPMYYGPPVGEYPLPVDN